MNLKCVARITAVHGKSTTGAFKDAIVSDRIEFTCPLTAAGGWTHTYAKYVHIYNERTGGECLLSFNQLDRTLKNFEFEEVS